MFSSLEALNDNSIEAPPSHIPTKPVAFRPKAKPRGSKGTPVSAKRTSSPSSPAFKAQSFPSSSIGKLTNETPDVGSAAAVTEQVIRDVHISLDAAEMLNSGQNLDDAAAQKENHSGNVDERLRTERQPNPPDEDAQQTQTKCKELAEPSKKTVRNLRSSESSLTLKAVGDIALNKSAKDKASSNPKDQKRKGISNIATQDSSSEVPVNTFILTNIQESSRNKKKGSAEESMCKTNNIDTSAEDKKGNKKQKTYILRARRGPKRGINPADPDLDPKKMTMRDIIRLAETKDRLFRKDEAKRSNGATESTFSVPVQEEQEERTSFAPQVQIVDGRIVINQESLTISAHPKDDVQSYRRVEETHSKLNYHSYTKRTARINWTKEETERFYQGLHEFGTNFAIIQQLFPGRTRKQIFLKYKREEKSCPLRVSEALILKPCEYVRYGEVMSLMNLQPNEIPEPEACQQDSLSPNIISQGEEILETQCVSTIDVESISEPMHLPNGIENVQDEKESIAAYEHVNLETVTSVESFQTKPGTDIEKCDDEKYEEELIVRRKRSLFSYQTNAK